MDAAKLLEAFNRLLDCAKSDPNLENAVKMARQTCYEVVGLDRETRAITDPESVIAAVRDFKPLCGWLRYQSKLVDFANGFWEAPPDQAGALLYGELCTADGRSMTIRPDGGGGWNVTVARELAGSDFLAETADVLKDAPVENDRPEQVLRYRIYWMGCEETGEFRRVFSRFMGFDHERQEGEKKCL